MFEFLVLSLLVATVWTQTSEVPQEGTPEMPEVDPNELQGSGDHDHDHDHDHGPFGGGGGRGGRTRCGFTFCPRGFFCVYTQGNCYWYWTGTYWYWYCPGYSYQCVWSGFGFGKK